MYACVCVCAELCGATLTAIIRSVLFSTSTHQGMLYASVAVSTLQPILLKIVKTIVTFCWILSICTVYV